MDTLILPKSKMLLSAANPLKEIVSPLYKKTNITLFSYVKIFNDHGLIDICDHEQVIESIYFNDSKLYADLPPDVCPNLLLNEYFLMSCNDFKNPALQYLTADIGLTDILIIAKKSEHFYETFWFGSDANTKFVNFCINNVHVLESFISYFKNHYDAIKLINQCEKDRMFRYVSEDTKLRNQTFINSNKASDNVVTFDIQSSHYDLFCDKIKNRYYFSDRTHSYLTKRETECFYWCAQGKTSEETALLLHISRKTVENHLENVKRKLDCNNKAALIRKAFLWNLL